MKIEKQKEKQKKIRKNKTKIYIPEEYLQKKGGVQKDMIFKQSSN